MLSTPGDILLPQGVVNVRARRNRSSAYSASSRLAYKEDVHVSWAVHPDEDLHLDVPRTAGPCVEDDVGRQPPGFATGVLLDGLRDRAENPVCRYYRHVG